MNDNQTFVILIMAVLFLFILPVYKMQTNKDFFSGLFKKKDRTADPTPNAAPNLVTKKGKQKNGTRGDLTYYLSVLLRMAVVRKMQLVSPGTITRGSETANVAAFLVHSKGVTGIHCLGFNGTITPGKKPGDDWTQNMNGEVRTFPDPAVTRKRYYEIVRPAMLEAGIDVPLDFVSVFTTKGVRLNFSSSGHPDTYTGAAFTDHLKSHSKELSDGPVDIVQTGAALAALAGIEELKEKEKEMREERKRERKTRRNGGPS